MVREYICQYCKYFPNCGDEERTEPCKGYKMISYEEYCKAEEADRKKTEHFFKDLVDSCKGTRYRWEICTDEMAELMGISLEKAKEWERKILKYEISERQNGGVVINA